MTERSVSSSYTYAVIMIVIPLIIFKLSFALYREFTIKRFKYLVGLSHNCSYAWYSQPFPSLLFDYWKFLIRTFHLKVTSVRGDTLF